VPPVLLRNQTRSVDAAVLCRNCRCHGEALRRRQAACWNLVVSLSNRMGWLPNVIATQWGANRGFFKRRAESCLRLAEPVVARAILGIFHRRVTNYRCKTHALYHKRKPTLGSATIRCGFQFLTGCKSPMWEAARTAGMFERIGRYFRLFADVKRATCNQRQYSEPSAAPETGLSPNHAGHPPARGRHCPGWRMHFWLHADQSFLLDHWRRCG